VHGDDLTQFHQLNNPSQLRMISEQCQQLMELLKQYPIQSPHPHQSFATNSVASTTSYLQTLNPKYFVFFASFVNIVPHLKHKINSWIIDTGATDHMISYPSLFTSITAIVSTHVKLPNGSIASITHIGTVKLSEDLTLTEVFCSIFYLQFDFS
jgi:hypothetical protein